jgi:hypothetical protein
MTVCEGPVAQPDPKHDSQTTDLIFQGHPPAHQLLARDDHRSDGRRRLHMHGLEEASASQVRQPEAPSFAEWELAMAADNAEQDASDVTIDDLRTRYVDQSNWRRNEQGFPYIEIAGRIIALYPVSAEDWMWMIYHGGAEPLAWLEDPGRLYAEGVGMGEHDARDEAWKAFRADLERLNDSADAANFDGLRTFGIDDDLF